jgi:predicted GH43/DUF377 family glycosyl hydrolase
MRSRDEYKVGCWGNWRRYEGNPILTDAFGETFDVTVNRVGGKYRMYLSWRSTSSIAFIEGVDGVHWEPPVVVLKPDFSTGWEDDVNRQIVVIRDGIYHMWYTGMKYLGAGDRINAGRSCIGYAASNDGITFKRRPAPVMEPAGEWEKTNLMCPHVLWDKERGLWRMWYSAGGFWEPDQIGYAESRDGTEWKRHPGNPVFRPEPKNFWERAIVSACQVFIMDGWYYMFYIGFEDMYKATINVARSRDGITAWQRFKGNPILSGGPEGSWDAEAVYKPWVEHEDGRWLLWANGRRQAIEQVGLYIHHGDNLGFTDEMFV